MNKGKHGLSGSELHEIHDRNMLNARLNELTQTANPPFIFAQVSDQEFLISKTKDAFTGIVASKEDGIDSAITAIVREIERVHKFGFTASEYARAKADYLRMLESAYNERNKVKTVHTWMNMYATSLTTNRFQVLKMNMPL